MIARESATGLWPWFIFLIMAWLNALVLRAQELVQQQGLEATLDQGGGQSFIGWGCLLMILYLLGSSTGKNAPLPTPHWLLPIALLCLVPLASFSWLAFGLAGGLLVIRCQDLLIRAIGVLILALALRGPLSNLLLNLFTDPLLAMDAGGS